MPQSNRRFPQRRPPPIGALIAASAIAFLASCTTTASQDSVAAGAIGTELAIDGRVVAVDTAPWAYDGNAVVTLATDAGTMRVQLPARWNLCKAAPPDDLQALRVGDRVEARGTVSAPGELVVCERPEHALRRRD